MVMERVFSMIKPLRLVIILCVILEACTGTAKPCTTQYIGGSPESKAIASETVGSFHESVGPEVYQCIQSIEFIELATASGFRRGQKIYIEDYSNENMPLIIRHEACHIHQDIVDPESSNLFSLEQGIPYEELFYIEEASRHNESFALTCAYGGEALSLIGNICTEDISSDKFEVFDIILKEIYRAQESPAQAPPMHWEEAGSIPWSRGTPIDDVRGAEGGVIRILMADTDMLYVDARTGEPVSMVPAESWESGPPTWPGLGLESWATAGDDTLLVMSITAGNGAKARRVLHQGTDGRRSRLACGRHQEHVFALEGSLWSLYVDEEADRLHWGRWVRE
jgi:hypothetical protein